MGKEVNDREEAASEQIMSEAQTGLITKDQKDFAEKLQEATDLQKQVPDFVSLDEKEWRNMTDNDQKKMFDDLRSKGTPAIISVVFNNQEIDKTTIVAAAMESTKHFSTGGNKWITIAEDFPNIRLTRDEALRNNEGNVKALTRIHCHVSPYPYVAPPGVIQYVNSDEKFTKNLERVIMVSPHDYFRSVQEFGCLEGFSEANLGSLKGTHKVDAQFARHLLEATSEEEAKSLIRTLSTNNMMSRMYGLGEWQGLDVLYPNFSERMKRIHKFQENWFPGEFKRGIAGPLECRKWLENLANIEF